VPPSVHINDNLSKVKKSNFSGGFARNCQQGHPNFPDGEPLKSSEKLTSGPSSEYDSGVVAHTEAGWHDNAHFLVRFPKASA
jgi:hypothetical protein